MPLVKMPDGAVVDMPDNPSPEQIDALQKLHAQPEMGTMEAVARKVTAGFGKGSGALASGLVSMANLHPMVIAARIRGMLGDKRDAGIVNALDATAQQVSGNANQYFSEIGDKAKMNPYTGSFLEGIGGALSNPTTGAAPVTGLVTGGTAGLGSELSAQTLGEGPAQRVVGSLLGGLAGGYGMSRFGQLAPNTQKLASEGLEGLTPEQLTKAQSFMESSAKQGVNVDLVQALEATGVPAGNLETIRNVLANNKSGNQVQSTLRQQPGQLDILAAKTVGGLPGEVQSTGTAANNLQKAASDVVQAAKDSRSSAVKADYAKAGPISEEARGQLIATAKAIMNRPGATDELKSKLADFVQKFSPGAGNGPDIEAARAKVAAATTPSARAAAQQELAMANAAAGEALAKPVHALDVDTAIGEVAGPYKGSVLTPANPKTTGQLKFAAQELDKILSGASAETKAASQKFAMLSRTQVDPLKQGLPGQFATPRGARPDVAASWTKFTALLKAGEDPNAKFSPIRALGKQLAKQDPEALPDAVKTYVSGEVGKAFPPNIEGAGMTAPDAAKSLWSALFADRNRYHGLKQAVAASAESLGQKPEDLVRGMDSFAQITKAAKTRPESVGGLQRQEVFSLGGKSYGADALRVFGFLPFEKAARGVEDKLMVRTFRQFDTLLTTPEGAAKLAELGRVPIMSQKAVAIFNSLGAAVREGEDGNQALSGQQ